MNSPRFWKLIFAFNQMLARSDVSRKAGQLDRSIRQAIAASRLLRWAAKA